MSEYSTPIDLIDTPALLVDLAAADRNIERMLRHFRGGDVSVRPHLKTVKSPAFARRLLDAGARGVCVAKLSEAEVMAAAGIEDILITTELAGSHRSSSASSRFCASTRRSSSSSTAWLAPTASPARSIVPRSPPRF